MSKFSKQLAKVVGMCSIKLILILSLISSISSDESVRAYMQRRKSFLKEERTLAVGRDICLNSREREANDVIKKYKDQEMRNAFKNPNEFPPAGSFLKWRSEIEKSRIFQLLQKMPKGASLHGHDSAMASAKYIVKDLTYRKYLFARMSEGDVLELKFYKKSPGKKWKRVSIMRKNAHSEEEFDEWLTRQISLNEDDADMSLNEIWAKFEGLFKKITPMLTYEPVWKDHFYQILKEFHEDNVSYLEVRGTLPPVYRLDGTTLNATSACGLYVEVLKKFKKDHPKFFGAKFIYAPLRFADNNKFQRYVDTALELKRTYPDFVAGFDLVGQEDMGGLLGDFAEDLLYMQRYLDFFFHAGETKWSGSSTDDNLVDAVLLGTKRIGHGYAITKHPKVAKFIKKNGIGVEVCPISNQVLGLVQDLRNHPASSMLMENYPIVIAPDDPGLWGAKGASYDWYEVFMGMASWSQDLHLLKKLALNSIEQSSLSHKERKDLIRDWKTRWNKFIKYLIKEGHKHRRIDPRRMSKLRV